MKERKRFRLRVVLYSLLISLVVVSPSGQLLPVQAQGGDCSCGGRIFNDPTNIYECGQCTWYASFMMSAIPHSNWGPAGDWNTAARESLSPRFSVGDIPYPGSIVVYEGSLPDIDDRGHVAYVEQTRGDSFEVSEMNWNGRCFNGSRWDTKRVGVSFIYPPTSVPIPLQPYPYHTMGYGQPLDLQWYGRAAPYEFEVRYVPGEFVCLDPNLASLLTRVSGISATSISFYDLTGAGSAVQGTYYFRVKGSTGSFGPWQGFYLCRSVSSTSASASLESSGGVSPAQLGYEVRSRVSLPLVFGGLGLGRTTDALQACPPNPTPIPTSTPFPEATGIPMATPRPGITPSATPFPVPIISCDQESQPGVYVYGQIGYQGNCIRLLEGCTYLGDTPVGDNQASSIRVVGDYWARLYEGPTCSGTLSDEFHQSDSNLDSHSLGHQYSSLEVFSSLTECADDTQPGVYLYGGIDYTGNCQYTTSDIPDLDRTAIGDNQLQSIRLVGSYSARLYESKDFTGRSDEINRSDTNLNLRSLGRQYSSVVVLPPPVSSATSVPRTATATRSPSPTRTRTATQVPRTATPLPTAQLTVTETPRPSPTPTRTATRTRTRTPSPSSLATWTRTPLPSATSTRRLTDTPPPPPTVGSLASSTVTGTPTFRPTATLTRTPIPSSTGTGTATVIPSRTPTPRSSSTAQPTEVPPPPPPPLLIPTATAQPRTKS